MRRLRVEQFDPEVYRHNAWWCLHPDWKMGIKVQILPASTFEEWPHLTYPNAVDRSHGNMKTDEKEIMAFPDSSKWARTLGRQHSLPMSVNSTICTTYAMMLLCEGKFSLPAVRGSLHICTWARANLGRAQIVSTLVILHKRREPGILRMPYDPAIKAMVYHETFASTIKSHTGTPA